MCQSQKELGRLLLGIGILPAKEQRRMVDRAIRYATVRIATLERERDEARDALARAEDKVSIAASRFLEMDDEIRKLEADRDEARAEVERLRKSSVELELRRDLARLRDLLRRCRGGLTFDWKLRAEVDAALAEGGEDA